MEKRRRRIERTRGGKSQEVVKGCGVKPVEGMPITL